MTARRSFPTASGPSPVRSLAAAVAAQAASNRSVTGHEDHLAGHRARMMREILLRAPAHGGGRLCLLGAGSANDVDLDELAGHFAEVHLVDIDRKAVTQAVKGVSQERRSRVVIHAPVDASGIFHLLDTWSREPPAASAILREADEAPGRVAAALPGPFDVVVSCCLLTQLQLVLLQVIGEQHLRFADLRLALGAIHVRTLTALLAPAGAALLVTDLTSSATFPLDLVEPEDDLGALMGRLLAANNVIYASHPGRLSAEIRRDPALAARFAVKFPVGPWLWHNGPEQIYLVYALEITHRRESLSST